MILYLLRNLINDKCYVGITTGSLEERWRLHLNRLKYGKKHGKDYALYQAMRKYGVENFTLSVLAEAESFDVLCTLEEEAIKAHNTFYEYGQGYNMTFGGEGAPGRRHTLEARAKMSVKIKAARDRDGNHWEGRQHSDETKAKMSAAKKGKPSPHRGKKWGPLSAETRQKMSAVRKGRPPWNKGKTMTYANGNQSWHAVEYNGVVYASVMECHRHTGLSRPTIREYIKKGKARYVKE